MRGTGVEREVGYEGEGFFGQGIKMGHAFAFVTPCHANICLTSSIDR